MLEDEFEPSLAELIMQGMAIAPKLKEPPICVVVP